MITKKQKIIVKIRKESNYYWTYFIELRRIIPVNYEGAEIIDLFFNKHYNLGRITNFINRKKEIIGRKEILNFLQKIKKDLLSPYEGGYPIIDKERLDAPIAIELQTNTQCNLRCKHCCQDNYDKIMPLRKVRHILDILNEKGIFEINLTGGEFFLHPNALEIIRLCCEKYSFATMIVTNGTLFLTKSLIKNLLKFKNDLVFLISLEGVEKINDEIRGDGVFNKVNKTIRTLKKYNFYVEISSTINKLNINHYQELINYSKSLNVPLNFNLFKTNQEFLVLTPYKYFRFVEKIFKRRNLYKENIGLTNAAIASELTNHGKRKTCRATLSGLSIDVEGRMVPCPFLEEVGYYKRKNLPKFDKNFLKTWKNNYYFKKFRQGNLFECQACSYIFSGDVKGKDPYGIKSFLDFKNRECLKK